MGSSGRDSNAVTSLIASFVRALMKSGESSVPRSHVKPLDPAHHAPDVGIHLYRTNSTSEAT